MKAPPAMPISFNQLPVSCMGWAMNTGTQVSRSNNTIINPNSSAASRALQLVAMHTAKAKKAAPVRYTQNKCPGIGKEIFGDIGGMPGGKAGKTKGRKPKEAEENAKKRRPGVRTGG